MVNTNIAMNIISSQTTATTNGLERNSCKLASIKQQTLALAKRGLIKTLRWPLSSAVRFVIIPFIIFGIALYAVNYGTLQNGERFVGTMALFLTIMQFYVLGTWLVLDKETGFKSLMIMMSLRKKSYYLGNSIIILVSILPIVWAAAAFCIVYLFKDSLIPSYNIILVFSLFAIHLSGYIHFWSAFITKSSLIAILLVPLVAEGFIHDGVLLLMQNSSSNLDHSIILFFGSMSPFESVRIFSDSYSACRNCDGEATYYKELNLVSESVYILYAAIIFWTIISYLFAYSYDEVCPYKSDSEPKKPLFCFETAKSRHDVDLLSDDIDQQLDPNFFEPSYNNDGEVGILVRNLTKIYNKVPVVKNFSFKIFKGETTLLLGHNGAGKTTLMNMMLRKVTPNQGTVTIGRGKDQIGIGVCPQESILDENLSVIQHLELFSDIKCSGWTSKEKAEHIRRTIEDVNLISHANVCPNNLSGGMKRKLSLGMAFVGKSKILILDEPSSGLDPDSRVFVWNAIRRYRSDRTVLLSTQHMEEADYLGDRIAIMSEGSLICCGSSVFLNNTFGTGYKLRIECDSSTKSEVLNFVRKYFETAHIIGEDELRSKKDSLVGFVIELNDDKSKDLESNLILMLEKMEEDACDELKIRSHGLRSSSIEDVMLNTSKWLHSTPSNNNDSTELNIDSMRDNLVDLVKSPQTEASREQILKALLVKHLQVYKSDWKAVLFFRVIVSSLCLWYNIRLYSYIPLFNANFLTCSMILHYIQFPIVERQAGFKIVQLTSQATIKLYWLSQLLIDSLSFLFNVIALNIILKTSFTGVFLESPLKVHLVISAAVFMYSISGASLAYVLASILPKTKSAIGNYSALFLISVYASIITMVIIMATGTNMSWMNTVTWTFVALLPSDAFQYAMYGLHSQCYIDLDTQCRPLGANYSPIAIGFLALSAQIIGYSLLLWWIERRQIQITFSIANLKGWLRRSKTNSRKLPPDHDVLNETANAESLITRVPADSYSLVASNLNKSYIRGIKVIDGLSFTVGRGECFGLLGVNGAGKSSTFSMVAAEMRPDSGRIWLNGHYNCARDLDKYRRSFGYDPQPMPDIALSPVEAFSLMARLRGVEEKSISRLVKSLLEVLDMIEHGNKAARDLSGGTKRKLALGMSLIGNPRFLALDEPTAGVDPLARRSVWRLLRLLQIQNNASILISSHAMEECEAICDRISIMAAGRIRCIGTFLHLRNKFSQGCSIRVQFNQACVTASSVPSLVGKLSERLHATVGPSKVKLTDSNANSATFAISDDQVKRSQLFKILREFREKHPAMSYILNDSSLEDIFLTMAKEQVDGQGEFNPLMSASTEAIV